MKIFPIKSRKRITIHFITHRFAWLLIGFGLAAASSAQELEPRRWNHLPKGVHIVGGGYAYTDATIAFNPVLRIEDADGQIHTALVKYIQTFSVMGRSARIGLAQGYQSGEWSGKVDGTQTTVQRNGLTDSVIRFSMALYGAPSLKGKEFAAYRAERAQSDTIVGAGLIVQLPTGQYYSDKLINLGSNRFTFRPQLGVQHSRGKISMELTGSVWLYTDNDDFFGGSNLENDPLYVLQGHLSYSFRPGLWVGGGLGYGYGKESTLNGVKKEDTTEKLAWGASAAYPFTRTFGAKLTYIGMQSQTALGADTQTISLGLSYIW